MAEPTLFQVTLGVADIAAAVRFYDRLGWQRHPDLKSCPDGDFLDEICFDIGGSRISIVPHNTMIEAAGLLGLPDVNSICPCITISLQMDQAPDVDSYLQLAKALGGTILKSGESTTSGRYFGYFMDPDGHIFEIIYNPKAL